MLVDGHSIGDVGQTILKERENLGKEGVLLVLVKGQKVEFISKGFIFNERELFKDLEEISLGVIEKSKDVQTLQKDLENKLSGYIQTKVKRSPQILAVVV